MGPHLTQYVAWTEAYLHAKFHLDSSNRLATMHQRHRQTDVQTHGQDNGHSDSIRRTVLQMVAHKYTLFSTVLSLSSNVDVLWPSGWMVQVGSLSPYDIVLYGDTAPPKRTQQLPHFRPMFIVAKRLDGFKMPIGTK